MEVTVKFSSLEEALQYLNRYSPAAPATEQGDPEPAPAVEAPKPKRTRKVAEAPAPAPVVEPTPVPVADPFEEEAAAPPPPPPVPVESEDDHKVRVRAALVAYQDRLTASGKELEVARVNVFALLAKAGDGAETLGELKRPFFDAVIKAANAA